MINNYPTEPDEDEQIALMRAEIEENMRRIKRTSILMLILIIVASVSFGNLLGILVFSK